jgi:LPPG:FO 2-phospho-L-lactate transferase
MVARLGGPSWFGLGDADLGTNLYRSLMLHEGETLTGATGRIARALDVAHPILPMTDDPVRTMLDTDQGTLGFQEYFVRERWQPLVRAIRFEGAEKAVPSPQVADALKRATLILIGPSNPFLSIDPILAITGLRAMIKESPAPCVAVSPIVGGKAIKGPAAKLMDELGLEVSPLGVAFHYEDHLNGFILDTVDSGFLPEISALGIRSAARNTLMTTAADKQELGAFILDWTEENLT